MTADPTTDFASELKRTGAAITKLAYSERSWHIAITGPGFVYFTAAANFEQLLELVVRRLEQESGIDNTRPLELHLMDKRHKAAKEEREKRSARLMAAMYWLENRARDPLSHVGRRNAGELLDAYDHKRRPGEDALEWLRQQTRVGDRIHKDWAAALLDRFQVIVCDLRSEK